MDVGAQGDRGEEPNEGYSGELGQGEDERCVVLGLVRGEGGRGENPSGDRIGYVGEGLLEGFAVVAELEECGRSGEREAARLDDGEMLASILAQISPSGW